jgi:vacuolar-type H+-ATPase subunit C/Vma6
MSQNDKYIRFTEENENEGEKWNFYYPRTINNLKFFKELKDILEILKSPFYEVDIDTIHYKDILEIVVSKYNMDGYFPLHNIVNYQPDYENIEYLKNCIIKNNTSEAIYHLDNICYKGRLGFK